LSLPNAVANFTSLQLVDLISTKNLSNFAPPIMSYKARMVKRALVYAVFAAKLLDLRGAIQKLNGKFDQDIAKTAQSDQDWLDYFYAGNLKFGSDSVPRSDVIVDGDAEDYYRFPIRVDPTYSTPDWRENGVNLDRCGRESRNRRDYLFDKYPRIISYDRDQKLVYPNSNLSWPEHFTNPGQCKDTDVSFYGPPWRPVHVTNPTGAPLVMAGGQMLDQPGVVYTKGDNGVIATPNPARAFKVVAKLINNSNYVLIIGDPTKPASTKTEDVYADWGKAYVSSMYCFPGQTINLAGDSGGSITKGVEAYYRFQAWKVPRLKASEELERSLKEINQFYEPYLIDRSPGATPKHEANFYAMLDLPAFGSNKINVVESRANIVYNLKTNAADINGGYRYSTVDVHKYFGEKLDATFTISKGYTVTAEIVVSDRT
jgi:hypothetical protein